MDRTVTTESVLQLIAIHLDHDGRSAKVISDLDPWQSHELIWKLLVVNDWILDLAVKEDTPAEEILAGIFDKVTGLDETKE